METTEGINYIVAQIAEMSVKLAELTSTLNSLKTNLVGNGVLVYAAHDNLFWVKPIGKECKILLAYKDVVWVEAENTRIHLHLSHSKLISVSCTIKRAEEFLPGDRFIRISRSEIININYLSKVCGNVYYLKGNTRRFITTEKYREQMMGRIPEL